MYPHGNSFWWKLTCFTIRHHQGHENSAFHCKGLLDSTAEICPYNEFCWRSINSIQNVFLLVLGAFLKSFAKILEMCCRATSLKANFLSPVGGAVTMIHYWPVDVFKMGLLSKMWILVQMCSCLLIFLFHGKSSVWQHTPDTPFNKNSQAL